MAQAVRSIFFLQGCGDFSCRNETLIRVPSVLLFPGTSLLKCFLIEDERSRGLRSVVRGEPAKRPSAPKRIRGLKTCRDESERLCAAFSLAAHTDVEEHKSLHVTT